MPGIPSAQRSWAAGLLPNQRITGGVLLSIMGGYVSTIGNQIIARGMTCSGSSNGVTAAMDGVNRCTNAAGFAVRSTIAAAPQSWLIISDGVVQHKFTYKSAADDRCVMAFSPGSLYVVASPATSEPTATDEQIINNGNTSSTIGSTAAGDRIVNVWVDSTHRSWRASIMSANVLCGPLIGVELFDSSPLVSPTTAPIPVWGFFNRESNISSLSNVGSSYTSQVMGGVARININGVATNCTLGGTFEIFNGTGANDDNVVATAQGNVPLIRPLGIAFSSGGVGKCGNRYDWYRPSDYQACGATTPGKEWIHLANSSIPTGGIWWPWDSFTTPVTA